MDGRKRNGAKPGERRGGRAKGVPNKTSLAQEKALAEGGIMPRDFMLQVMRDEKREFEIRFDAAKAVAPYCHPRFQTTTMEHKGSVEVVSKEQRDASVAAAMRADG